MNKKSKSEDIQIKTSSFLRLDLSGTEPVIYDGYELQDCAADDERLMAVLERLQKGGTISHATSEIVKELSCTSAEASEYLADLEDVGLLTREDDSNRKVVSMLAEKWNLWNWGDAFWFHLAAMDYPFLDYALPPGRKPDYDLMREYLTVAPVPSKYKEYPDSPFLPFEAFSPRCEDDVNSLGFFERGSTRTLPGVLDKKTLGSFLYLTVGQIGVKPWPDQGEFVRRTSPSGGARHPTEAYIFLLGVKGMKPSIAHYDVRRHGLNTICEFDSATHLFEKLCEGCSDLRSRLNGSPAAVIFYSSVFERAMWRYRDTRSHRVNYIDVGHILFTARCVADYVGSNLVPGHGINETIIEKMLGLDGINEGIITFCSLGVP